MNVPELVNRLSKDLKTESAGNLSLSSMQQVNGAINQVLQTLWDLSPVSARKIKTVVAFTAPKTISIGVTAGSTAFTGWTPSDEDMYCSINIDGDGMTNEISGSATLLLPYAGTTGTKTATVFHDSVAVPSNYQEIVFPLLDVDDRYSPLLPGPVVSDKQTGEPEWAWVDDNASGVNPTAPAVISLNTLPTALKRYQFLALLSPPRVTLPNMTESTAVVPMRYEHIESRLIPAVRGKLAGTDLWRNEATRQNAIKEGEQAIASYSLVPQHNSTPDNRVGTPYGW